MAQLLKPGDVKIITKDGQITVKLEIDLNINLNQTGNLTVTSDNQSPGAVKTSVNKDSDETEWMIPDFGPTTKIKFGK